ncbi:hypothetical protein GCM10012280_58340 [Wenjunlia tyrosinilytica]|uniref:Uncharacterized protein n=1 Tax=Wenjunlia tyrosinilytica TaxID=1544741 RepID=A0A918E0H6_9ACTN|nr:hypothetical protein GCM10012280_58340 [Wenjunlia tyrosinilytica]
MITGSASTPTANVTLSRPAGATAVSSTHPHGVRHLFAAYDLAKDKLCGHIKPTAQGTRDYFAPMVFEDRGERPQRHGGGGVRVGLWLRHRWGAIQVASQLSWRRLSGVATS